MSRSQPWLDWTVFGVVLITTMLLDRILCSRNEERVSFRNAAQRSILWLSVGIGFTAWEVYAKGVNGGLTYLAAYLVEKSLSVDNLFVFLVIFRHFSITAKQQERVLFWGVFGAVILRALFIVVGTVILHRFHWAFYVFGGFLVYSGFRLLIGSDKTVDPEHSFALVLARRYLRTSSKQTGAQFFLKENGKYFATPLFLVLIVVELTDVLFAVDSVPAVLGISSDLYVVYTSNIMAILGLRALYFVLSGMMGRFHKLDWALAAILTFVGLKMMVHDFMKIPNWVSLSVIGGLLCLGIVASLLLPVPPTEAQSPKDLP
jgi:tellurite resistance protein TerC